jgi:hypothetical protein
MTLTTLCNLSNVSSIVFGSGRVNAYCQENNPLQLSYKEGVDVNEWIVETRIVPSHDFPPFADVVESDGVLSQAISDGREVLLFNVDRMPTVELAKLHHIIQGSGSDTHFTVVL